MSNRVEPDSPLAAASLGRGGFSADFRPSASPPAELGFGNYSSPAPSARPPPRPMTPLTNLPPVTAQCHQCLRRSNEIGPVVLTHVLNGWSTPRLPFGEDAASSNRCCG